MQFTVLGKPDDVHAVEESLRDVLSNITGARANVSDLRLIIVLSSFSIVTIAEKMDRDFFGVFCSSYFAFLLSIRMISASKMNAFILAMSLD